MQWSGHVNNREIQGSEGRDVTGSYEEKSREGRASGRIDNSWKKVNIRRTAIADKSSNIAIFIGIDQEWTTSPQVWPTGGVQWRKDGGGQG
jgi:hypothetical protein